MIVLGAGAVSRGMRLGGGSDGLSCRNAQANVQAAPNNGFTALICSAQKGHDSCLRHLLAAKVHSCAMPMTARVNTVCSHLSQSRCGLSQACVCVCVGRRGMR